MPFYFVILNAEWWLSIKLLVLLNKQIVKIMYYGRNKTERRQTGVNGPFIAVFFNYLYKYFIILFRPVSVRLLYISQSHFISFYFLSPCLEGINNSFRDMSQCTCFLLVSGTSLSFVKKKKKRRKCYRTVLVVCLPPTPSSDVPGLLKAGKASVGVNLSCQSNSTTQWLADGLCFLITPFLFLWAHSWWPAIPNLILWKK